MHTESLILYRQSWLKMLHAKLIPNTVISTLNTKITISLILENYVIFKTWKFMSLNGVSSTKLPKGSKLLTSEIAMKSSLFVQGTIGTEVVN